MKRKWEIWVAGMTTEGNVNKCVGLFEDTPGQAILMLEYAAESYPACRVTLQTRMGQAPVSFGKADLKLMAGVQ